MGSAALQVEVWSAVQSHGWVGQVLQEMGAPGSGDVGDGIHPNGTGADSGINGIFFDFGRAYIGTYLNRFVFSNGTDQLCLFYLAGPSRTSGL